VSYVEMERLCPSVSEPVLSFKFFKNMMNKCGKDEDSLD
jgi:hypothetical protein